MRSGGLRRTLRSWCNEAPGMTLDSDKLLALYARAGDLFFEADVFAQLAQALPKGDGRRDDAIRLAIQHHREGMALRDGAAKENGELVRRVTALTMAEIIQHNFHVSQTGAHASQVEARRITQDLVAEHSDYLINWDDDKKWLNRQLYRKRKNGNVITRTDARARLCIELREYLLNAFEAKPGQAILRKFATVFRDFDRTS
jgi:hypothetical protein